MNFSGSCWQWCESNDGWISKMGTDDPLTFFDLNLPNSGSMAYQSHESFPVEAKFLISSHDRSGFGVLGNDF